jgi:hypothetical protein
MLGKKKVYFKKYINKYLSPDPSRGRKRQICSRYSKWDLELGAYAKFSTDVLKYS